MVAGSAATRILAGFGAESIRLEWPDPPAFDSGREIHWNCDKLSLSLNMRHPKALDLAKRVVASSDIFTESMRPGTIGNLGLDYETVRAVKPNIIYLSMSGWGQDGPHRDWGSYGASSAAHSGLAFLGGMPDLPPCGLPVAYADESPPWLAASAILMALHHRRRTGEGMHIDMAQTQVAATFTRHFHLDRSVNGRSARREGFPAGNTREYPPSAPHNAFPCRGNDTWCVIAVTRDEEWEGLKEAMGNASSAADPKYDSAEGRFKHRRELEGLLAEWTRTFERFHLAAVLQDHGVPAGPVESAFDLAEFDVQLAHRGTFHLYPNPDRGPGRHKISVPRLLKTPHQPKRGIPNIGQDNAYVLHTLLGLSNADIDALAADGVIRFPERSGVAGGV